MDRIDNITVFVAVAEHESFAAAARKLSRTPASVTRAVAELEEHLSARLLNRTTRSVALTEAGHRYLDLARRLLAANAEFEGAEPDDPEPHGVLLVTAPTNFGRQHLLPLANAFLEKYPRIDLRLLLLDRVVSMVDEGLDVGVRIGKLPDSSLRATRVGTVKMSVYASPTYIARHGVPASPAELIQHRTISCNAVNPVTERWSFEGAGGVSHVAVRPRLVVNTTEAAADAAASGLGLVFLVSYQTAQHVAAGRLVEVLSQYSVEQIPIHIIQPAGRFTPSKVRAFIDDVGAGLRRKFG